jgi:HEAT repeat protein
MDFASSWIADLERAGIIVEAILLSLFGIILLIAAIAFRRWYRGRYFRRLSQRTSALRGQWDDIISGRIPASAWRQNPLDCEIVEAMLLDAIEIASDEQLPELIVCLRNSGLLDMRIREARSCDGWKKRTALIALGRTRALEAVPALAEALDSPSKETRVAAVRGLGRLALPAAAVPLLDRFLDQEIELPAHTLKNALVNCCRSSPQTLIPYLDRSTGPARELLARILGELATPNLGEELLLLAADPLPEVRASAARALAHGNPKIAFPVLSTLAADSEWFVRLRAVIAIGSIEHPEMTRVLLRALCDSNRHVRQRAAWTLARLQPRVEVLEQVVATNDNYALQAFLSELERTGSLDRVFNLLESSVNQDSPQTDLEKIAQMVRERFQTLKTAAAKAGQS